MNYRVMELWNPGVLIGQLPTDLFNELKTNCISGTLVEKYNDQLVANIKEEYKYPHENHPQLTEFLIQTYNVWRETFRCGNILLENEYPDVLDVWVNKQGKGEYNPNHNHGGHVSFVIWVKIPYEIDEELKVDHYTKKNDILRKAAFEFTYSTMNHGLAMHTMWINKYDEGTIIMFPANMLHCVYPFTTSDEYRISVAGNLLIKSRRSRD